MANYYLTGVWKNDYKVVTHATIHLVEKNSVYEADKKTVSQIVALIETGNFVYTARWNYANIYWTEGARVEVFPFNGVKHIRSVPNSTPADNVDNMLPMSNLGY